MPSNHLPTHQIAQREQPPPAPLSNISSTDYESSMSGTGTTTPSKTHSSDTNYGLISLQSDCTDETIGAELTLEEIQWLKLAHEFTAAEKPFKEQKTFRVARKLRTWHPKRGVTWSFLRRLYNGRQDMKEEELNETLDDLTGLSINEKQ